MQTAGGLTVRPFQLYSAQTGDCFEVLDARDEGHAVDLFAQARGWADARAMWSDGYHGFFIYVSARPVQS